MAVEEIAVNAAARMEQDDYFDMQGIASDIKSEYIMGMNSTRITL